MLTVDQIPYEVKRAMRVAWAKRKNSDAPEKVMADLAVAMLNAWPGVGLQTSGRITGSSSEGEDLYALDHLILPLTQENNNGSD